MAGFLRWCDPSGADTNIYLLINAEIGPYVGRSADVYKCPADRSKSHGTTGLPRCRSISMNGYVRKSALLGTALHHDLHSTPEANPGHLAIALETLDVLG